MSWPRAAIYEHLNWTARKLGLITLSPGQCAWLSKDNYAVHRVYCPMDGGGGSTGPGYMNATAEFGASFHVYLNPEQTGVLDDGTGVQDDDGDSYSRDSFNSIDEESKEQRAFATESDLSWSILRRVLEVTWNHLRGWWSRTGTHGLKGSAVPDGRAEEEVPNIGRHEQATAWLQMWQDLGRAPRTIDAYARGLAEYLELCKRESVDPVRSTRAHIALHVRELVSRPSRRGSKAVALDSGAGLSNATLQQRRVSVRLFYDFLIEEGLRQGNPVGRGRYTRGPVVVGSSVGWCGGW
ncbi:hypothetical protein [Streptomyces sp. NPDC059649]|uniref:hypothetical protein n=1 Tax=Streptomyces sp. NPDC059649 TaxID=3346895 RepID=UPI00367F598A